LKDLSLVGASQAIQGSGSVNFNHTLDLRLQLSANTTADRATKSAEKPAGDSVELTGALPKPSVKRIEATAPKP